MSWRKAEAKPYVFVTGPYPSAPVRIFGCPLSSCRQGLGVVADGPVQVAQLKGLVPPLRDLSNEAGGLAGDYTEARDDHVGGHDGAVEDADVVLDDGELSDGDLCADVDVAADGGGLDDGGGADKDVVADAEGHVGEGAAAFQGCQ